MKKIISLALALVMLCAIAVSFTSCKTSDVKKIEKNGYFVCGVTVYEPMNYKDAKGNWTGFDTEFAQAVAKELGVEVKFQEIDWPQKYTELESGKIDLIWNGFTLGDEDGVPRSNYVDFTYAYLENRQCIVTTKDNLTKLNTKDAFKGKRAVAEGGSSGAAVAEELAGKDNVTTFTAQSKALVELIAGNADFAVIDYQMAKSMVGKADYASLSINPAYEPEPEVYAIGCRKGSDLTAKINEAIKKLSEDGTLAAIAAKYDLTNDLIAEIGSK